MVQFEIRHAGFCCRHLEMYVLNCFMCESVGHLKQIWNDIKIFFVSEYCLTNSSAISEESPFPNRNTKVGTFSFLSMTAIYYYATNKCVCASFTPSHGGRIIRKALNCGTSPIYCRVLFHFQRHQPMLALLRVELD